MNKEMKRILLLIFLIIVGNVIAQSQSLSPMDEYETEMKREYKLHDIAGLTNYVIKHQTNGKTEFEVNGRKYKMKVNRYSSKAEIDEVVTFEVKLLGANGKPKREFRYDIINNKVKLWSDKLSFLAYFDLNKMEVSIRRCGYNFNHSEFKMYGYDYSFKGKSFVKVEDWVIRDANGRANSMNNQYVKK